MPAKSMNIDNTVTAKPTPAPIRPSSTRAPLVSVPQPAPNVQARPTPVRPYRQAGAPTARSTPIPMMTSPTIALRVFEKSSPVVYPAPRVPTAACAPIQKSMKHARHADKPAFRRLATDRSDDIADFDDPSPGLSPLQKLPERPEGSKSRAGKRERSIDGKSPGVGRHSKKLVRGRLYAKVRSLRCCSGRASEHVLSHNSRKTLVIYLYRLVERLLFSS